MQNSPLKKIATKPGTFSGPKRLRKGSGFLFLAVSLCELLSLFCNSLFCYVCLCLYHAVCFIVIFTNSSVQSNVFEICSLWMRLANQKYGLLLLWQFNYVPCGLRKRLLRDLGKRENEGNIIRSAFARRKSAPECGLVLEEILTSAAFSDILFNTVDFICDRKSFGSRRAMEKTSCSFQCLAGKRGLI